MSEIFSTMSSIQMQEILVTSGLTIESAKSLILTSVSDGEITLTSKWTLEAGNITLDEFIRQALGVTSGYSKNLDKWKAKELFAQKIQEVLTK